MWKQLLELGKRLASLIQSSQQHDEDIKRLKEHQAEQDRRIARLADAVQQLAFALQHDRDMSARDRENLLLRLENALLRLEQRLPAPSKRRKTTDLTEE